jgi:hypothetical protein
MMRFEMNPLRISIGILLAPWATPAAIVVHDVIRAGGSWPYQYELAWILMFSVITSYLGLIILGLPLTFLLARFHRLDFLKLIVLGVLTGAVTIIVFQISFPKLLGSTVIFKLDQNLLLAGGGLGALTAATFGVIAGVPLRRNNKSPHPSP